MLVGLTIRDVVLVEGLELASGPGLTTLTGETGAGKSVVLGALELAAGARAEAGLVRRGATQASVTALFAPPPDSPVWPILADKGFDGGSDEDLVLRRIVGADGRSRAFVNDQPSSVGVLREIGEALMEVHGQHETVGFLDFRTHRALLDRFGGLDAALAACASAWKRWRETAEAVVTLEARAASASEQEEALSASLADLDRLAPLEGEADRLAQMRAVLGAAEKTLAEVDAAREHLGGEALASRLGAASRALERARDRTLLAGASAEEGPTKLIALAVEAADRAHIEVAEALAAIDAAADALVFEPDELERAEERLFALRGMARKLQVDVDALPGARADMAAQLAALETATDVLAEARREAATARQAYDKAAAELTVLRQAAGAVLAGAVVTELQPLKLEQARFRVAVDPLAPERSGPSGRDRVEFEIATLPGSPFAPLSAIASGGELARFALALRVCLAARDAGPQPLMIFDEVDQGVGGAVADAIGARLKRLAANAQVVAITHSPQVAARADHHWRVRKTEAGGEARAQVEVLSEAAREEEIARMLSGATVTEAARAAARALIHA